MKTALMHWAIALSSAALAACGTTGNDDTGSGGKGAGAGGTSNGNGGTSGGSGSGGVAGSSAGAAGSLSGAGGTSAGNAGSGGGGNAQILARKRRIAVSDTRDVCVVTPSRTVACWGTLGSNDPPVEMDFDAVASGGSNMCGRKLDGTIVCWGDADVSPSGTFTDFSLAGETVGCALRASDGLSECWRVRGSGDFPAGAPQTHSTEIDVGQFAMCARAASGSISCWGSNDDGEATPPSGAFAQFGFGWSHGCAISAAGLASCWGLSDNRSPPPGTVLKQVDAGPDVTCGILTDGSVDCWTLNTASDLLVVPQGQFIEVSVGGSNACAVRSDGEPICWPDITGGTPRPAGVKVLLD